jgi:PBP1b-binding outer membrane lipoprotein LpoB
MKTKITAIAIGLLIVLTGCASSPSSTEPTDNLEPAPDETSTSVDADFAIQTVKERYEVDCFAGLGDETVYRYEENAGGTMREGFVYASVGGNILQFAVGVNENTGAFLTFPENEITTELLESVGC